MRKRLFFTGVVAFLIATSAFAENWPQWRGPSLNGLSGEKNLPTRWSAEENVTWKLTMPSWTGATPVIWDDRIFLNVADGDNLFIWSVDRTKGELIWKKMLGSGNTKMRKQNMSSPSPVTDGKSVWVMTGTGVLKAFDFNGNELWVRDVQKDYGRFGLNWGYASSPLLYEEALYVQVLHGMRTDEASYVMRIDKKTGKTVWKVERLQNSRAGHHPDVFAVSDRRGRRHVLLAHLGVARAEMLLPKRLAFCAIHAPEKQVVAFSDIQKNAFAPDDRGCAGPARQGELPRDVFFDGPLEWEIFFAADAVERRPSPLRPVVTECGCCREDDN